MGREVRMKAGLLRAEREGRKAGTAKWAVASLVFGAFTAIPIGASAAVVIFSPEYYVGITGVAGGWSDMPQTVTRTGPGPAGDFSALATSSPGSVSINFVAVANTQIVNVPAITAEMRYFVEAVGLLGAPVLVHADFAGSVRVAGDVGSNGYMGAEGTISGPGGGGSTTACVTFPSGGCSQTGTIGSMAFEATAGEIYTIDLLVRGYGEVECAGCVEIGNAYLDPYLWIDPSQADQFSLLISPGVPNIPLASGVPEPSTWAMMMLGFGVLGFMGWRGSRKTAAHAA